MSKDTKAFMKYLRDEQKRDANKTKTEFKLRLIEALLVVTGILLTLNHDLFTLSKTVLTFPIAFFAVAIAYYVVVSTSVGRKKKTGGDLSILFISLVVAVTFSFTLGLDIGIVNTQQLIPATYIAVSYFIVFVIVILLGLAFEEFVEFIKVTANNVTALYRHMATSERPNHSVKERRNHLIKNIFAIILIPIIISLISSYVYAQVTKPRPYIVIRNIETYVLTPTSSSGTTQHDVYISFINNGTGTDSHLSFYFSLANLSTITEVDNNTPKAQGDIFQLLQPLIVGSNPRGWVNLQISASDIAPGEYAYIDFPINTTQPFNYNSIRITEVKTDNNAYVILNCSEIYNNFTGNCP